MGVEPDYLLYFLSQRWTPILNEVATPTVIERYLGGPRGEVATLWSPPFPWWGVSGAASLKLKTDLKFPCKSLIISSQSGSFIRWMI